MVLPFVRELLADLEHSESFERVRRHLSAGTGRRRVSGLTFTARALYLPFFVRADFRSGGLGLKDRAFFVGQPAGYMM